MATLKPFILALLLLLVGGDQNRIPFWRVRLPYATNPISAARQASGSTTTPNATWNLAGVEGGIPTGRTQCVTAACNTLAGGTVTATTIQNALASASSGQYVSVPAGSYSVGGFTFDESNVTLRGAGAGTGGTKLTATGTVSGCSLAQQGFIRFCAGSGHLGTTDNGGPGPDNSATWDSGYSQGSTTITLNSHTALTVGHTITLDQQDDASDGYPATGDLYVCASELLKCSFEGGGSYYRTQGTNRSQLEFHKVVSCGTSTPGAACTSNTVVISPGIYAPNFRSSQSPGAWWADTSLIQHDSGIENMTIDYTATQAAGIMMVNCTNCWVINTRLLFVGSVGSFTFGILNVDGFHDTFRGNYIYGPTTSGTTRYPITNMNASLVLIEDTIFDANNIAIADDDPVSANVVAYNYNVNGKGFAAYGPQPHAPGGFMVLWEGNDFGNVITDNIHGATYFNTWVRNALSRFTNQDDTACNDSCAGFAINSHNRFHNFLGNVIANSGWTTYEVDAPSSSPNVYIWGWGYPGSHGIGSAFSCPDVTNCPSPDTNVKRTAFRWGNYDSVNAAVRYVASEVPTGITNYPNTLPPANSVPSSLYLSAQPSWWAGGAPWPPIGGDVNGGNVSNMGGHVNKIPARIRYEAGTNDSAYGSSSPRVKIDITP